MLTYDIIFAPKMSQIGPFSPKIRYFDQIDPINNIFDQGYVIKPDRNNFLKCLSGVSKNYFSQVYRHKFG